MNVLANAPAYQRIIGFFGPIAGVGNRAAAGEKSGTAGPGSVVDEILFLVPDANVHVGAFGGEEYANSRLGKSHFDICISEEGLHRMETDAAFKEGVLNALSDKMDEVLQRLDGMYVAVRGMIVENDGTIGSWSIELPDPADRNEPAYVLMLQARSRRAARLAGL